MTKGKILPCVTASYRGVTRKVVLEVGKKYRIESLNPLNKKNCGRVVMLLGFDDDFFYENAIIKYLDVNRRGKVRCSELVAHTD